MPNNIALDRIYTYGVEDLYTLIAAGSVEKLQLPPCVRIDVAPSLRSRVP